MCVTGRPTAVLRLPFAAAELGFPEYFEEGQWKNYKAAYVYFVVIVNFSQLWASACGERLILYAAGCTLLPNPVQCFAC